MTGAHIETPRGFRGGGVCSMSLLLLIFFSGARARGGAINGFPADLGRSPETGKNPFLQVQRHHQLAV